MARDFPDGLHLDLGNAWSLVLIRILELFIAFSTRVLGIPQLQDLMTFATGFAQYELIEHRYVPYRYVYPFV